MENLAAALVARGLPVAVLNPLQSARFQQEALMRTKTDALDALGLARLGQQKRSLPATLPDHATEQLRELVRNRDRLVQDCGDSVRQLHRLLDLTFPDFKHHIALLDTVLALTILKAFPTATDVAAATPRRLAKLRHGPRHLVGDPLARQFIAAAKQTVAAQSGDVYRVRIRHAREDLALWRTRLLAIGYPDRQVATPAQRRIVGRPVFHPVAGTGDLVAAGLIDLVRHQRLDFSGPPLYPLALPTTTSPGFVHQRHQITLLPQHSCSAYSSIPVKAGWDAPAANRF